MAKRQPMLHEIQGMDFPDYEFQEFPKWIKGDGALQALVKSKAEEDAQLAAWAAAAAPLPEAPKGKA